MKPSIDLLDAGLKEIIETQGCSSKSKIISGLFERITEAMSEGITLDMLVDYLRQNDILITKNTLRNTLYRIRKKRGKKTDKVETTEIAKPLTTSSHSQVTPIDNNQNTDIPNMEKLSVDQFETGLDYWQALLKQFSNTKGNIERYVLLGGDRKKIESESISEQRNMVTLLKMKLSDKYNR